MKHSGKLFLIISIFCIAFALTGCSTGNSDEDFGDSSDVDYLMNEYADQLVRDGAQTVIGTIEVTGSEDEYSVTVDEKKIVPNKNYEDGYYIADKNITKTYPLGSDLGILTKEGDEIVSCTAEDFIKKHSGDTETLYTVYLFGDVAEFAQPLDPKTVADAAE